MQILQEIWDGNNKYVNRILLNFLVLEESEYFPCNVECRY